MTPAKPTATPGAEQAAAARQPADALSLRVVVEHIQPEVDAGRFPIKRTIGESVDVTAKIFTDGHDVVVAFLRDRHHDVGSRISSAPWRETAMTMVAPGTDEWSASFDVFAIGWHEYQIVAWSDRYLTWRRDLRAKAAAGQDVGVELLEGSLIVREAASRAEQIGVGNEDAARLLEHADRLSDSTRPEDQVAAAMDDDLANLMAVYADRSRATTSDARRAWVDRERARFGAWYEMFPRSAGPDPRRSGTFREAAGEL